MEYTDKGTVDDEGELVKATAQSMVDNSPVYEDGNFPMPNEVAPPKKTAYS